MNHSYAWSDGSSQATLGNPIIGTYSVVISDFNGCEKVDSIDILPSSVVQHGDHSSLYIYPNPATDCITIEGASLSHFESAKIYSMEGELMKTQAISETKNRISTAFLNPGIYMLTLEGKEPVTWLIVII